MIRYLRGKIVEKVRNHVVIDVHGVGYNVFVPVPAIATIVTGEDAELYISESIREDAHDLYGFKSPQERDAFEMLRKVSGVGPKVALAIVGFYSIPDFHTIITTRDTTKLSLIPGIGKKMADKIVLELRDKSIPTVDIPIAHEDPDTIDALHSLGYSASEIAQILPKVPASLNSSNERITWILRHLGE